EDSTVLGDNNVYGVIGKATFWANNQRVVANGQGEFLSYSQSNATYDNGAITQYCYIKWRRDRTLALGSEFEVIHQEFDVTHPPALATDENDDVYALLLRPRYSVVDPGLDLYVIAFRAAAGYAEPTPQDYLKVRALQGGSGAGKFTLAYDEEHRLLYAFVGDG